MRINRRYRRDCKHRRAASIARLESSLIIVLDQLLLSRMGPCLFVWRRSARTGRPRLISTWEHYGPALKSMQRASNVRSRAKYWEVRHENFRNSNE